MADQHSVLIVEDNDFVRMQIVNYLKADGYDTREASAGDAALQVMAETGIDLAIVDLRMEPMGGFEFLKIIRAQDISTPVILVAGDQTPDILELSGKLGVAAVLMKPVDKARLLGTVMRTIRGANRA